MSEVLGERVVEAHKDLRPEPRPMTGVKERRDEDPLAAVLGLGDRAARVGAAIGLGLALTTHGALSGKALASAALHETRLLAQEMRAQIHDYLWTTYEVELPKVPEAEKPKEPDPPQAPEPEPEPKLIPKIPIPTNAPPPKEDPYDPPPAAAEAAKILTRDPDPNEIVDMTDRGIASGEGNGVGYGQVAGAGTAKAPTYDPNAKVGGVPGGTGTGKPGPAPAPAGPDRSRAPQFIGGLSWSNCPFPPEADADQIDQARVMIAVTVRPDGSPLSVKVVSDPGHGFGRAARICALSRRYSPGLDRAGNPIIATTPPFAVRFTR